MRSSLAAAGLTFLIAISASAQKLNAKIVDRQDREDAYDYAAVYNNVAVGKSFKVNGATFTLQLPDGRLAVVNCESKFAERFAGPVGNRRSCRMPIVDRIEVEFNGDKAKLIWSVSLDGKKMQSETYQVLGILDQPPDNEASHPAPTPMVAPTSAPAPSATIAQPHTRPAILNVEEKQPPGPIASTTVSAGTDATVSITSDTEGAEIFVDSVGRGHAPMIIKLPTGRHSIQLVLAGYKDGITDIELKGGAIVNVSATFQMNQ
jgi:hypothetical protein